MTQVDLPHFLVLKIDVIVNAANSALRGCFIPCHSCVDNIIHSVSGIQLRLACDELMIEQGYDEPTGKAKITPAFNLPCNYVLHTVGPIVSDIIRRHKGLQVLLLPEAKSVKKLKILEFQYFQLFIFIFLGTIYPLYTFALFCCLYLLQLFLLI